MKNIIFKSNRTMGFAVSGKLALLAMFLILLGGCTKDFEKMNTNPTGITDEQLLPDFNNIGLYYPGIQQSIFGGVGEYQVTDDLLAANYAGYSQSPNPFSGNINNVTYALVDGDNAAVFDLAYGGVMGPVNTIASKDTRTESPDFWSIAVISKRTDSALPKNDFRPAVRSVVLRRGGARSGSAGRGPRLHAVPR